MEEQVIVLSVKKYDFKDGDNRQVSGCTVHYYPAPTFDSVKDASGVLGLQPLKATMPLEFYETAERVGIPCEASVTYVMRSIQGQMVLKPESIKFAKEK